MPEAKMKRSELIDRVQSTDVEVVIKKMDDRLSCWCVLMNTTAGNKPFRFNPIEN